jgi:hypothetical protein
MYIPGQLSLAALVSLVSSHLYPSLSSSSQHPGHPHAAAVLSPWEGGIQPTDLTSSQGLSLFSDWRGVTLSSVSGGESAGRSDDALLTRTRHSFSPLPTSFADGRLTIIRSANTSSKSSVLGAIF